MSAGYWRSLEIGVVQRVVRADHNSLAVSRTEERDPIKLMYRASNARKRCLGAVEGIITSRVD